ncbi:hypothetical protein F4802DRAFT_134303 [Xylaria palmicola]|nr:hypothetical protein F4802DRAFT_134303 [Xylaria palmicola]
MAVHCFASLSSVCLPITESLSVRTTHQRYPAGNQPIQPRLLLPKTIFAPDRSLPGQSCRLHQLPRPTHPPSTCTW